MYHIIVNPASRSGKGHKIWKEQVEPALNRGGVAFRSHFSQKAGDVAKIAADILASAETFPLRLIILGGDGTVNEALQGIPDPSQVILGYIPTGSSNDLARDLHIPTDPAAALDLILHTEKPVFLDLGTVAYEDGETRRFCVSCGIGYDAAVCEEALHSKIKYTLNKLGLGKLTYLGIALKQLFASKAVSCRLIPDGETPIHIEGMLFTACMIHRFEGGGFMFAPDADPADGILNLCTVGDLPRGLILFALPTAFKGKHYLFRGITPYRTGSLCIEASAPLWVHTDGEVTRKAARIHITCERQSLRILAPASACGKP